jgi:hypothetical protein
VSSPPTELSRRGRPVLWLVLFAAGAGLCLLAGYRMTIPGFYFQLLAREPLTTRLAESLWNLHSQPPLLNLVLGLALKLQRATGWAAERSLLWLHLALGAATTLVLWHLLARLGVSRWPRRLALLYVLLDPAFYVFLLLFFYTPYEIALLAAAALAVQRFLATRRASWYAAACGCLVTLTYFRSLFHFAWTLAVLLVLAWAVRPSGLRLPERRIVLAFAGSALLLLAWPAKNLLRFGFFGSSSWQGYNLSQGIVRQYPSIWAAFALGSPPGQEQARETLARTVPERFRSIPVLADATKGDGSPNWNHYSIILLSRALENGVLHRLREHPGLLAVKAKENYRKAVMEAIRSPYDPGLERQAPTRLAWIWLRTHEEIADLYFGEDPQTGPLPGFAYVLPAALILVAVQLVRRRKSDPVGAGTVAFLFAAILWVLAMVLLVDGREANRISFPAHPLLAVAVAWSLSRSPGSAPPASPEPSEPSAVPER